MPENDAPSAAPESPAEPTTPATEDTATLQKRLAGTHRALTEAQAIRDAEKARADKLATEAEELRRWKAEQEQASMTEYEKAQARIAQLEKDVATSRAEAQRQALARKFPLSFDALGDAAPTDETALAALEARLAPKAPDAEPEEPLIDPNRPRSTARQAPADSPADFKRLVQEQAEGYVQGLRDTGKWFQGH